MSQISVAPEVTSSTLSDYIRKDGATVTTGRIPFAEGISVPTGDPTLVRSIRVGSSPSPTTGQTSQLHITSDDSSGANQFLFAVTNETSVTFPYGSTVFFQGGGAYSGGGASAIGGAFILIGGRGYGGNGGTVLLEGGRDNSASGGLVDLLGGATSGGNNRGYVRVGQAGAPDKFSLTSDDAKRSLYVNKALEVDGIAYFDSTVRLDSLTASRLVKTDASKNLTSLALSSTYSVTNVTTDRSYDANSLTVDELADVVGTLISDLQAAGILG